MASRLSNYDDTPSLVLVGVPNKSALEAVMERLARYRIPFESFEEPDYDLGLTAVATYPITNKKQRRALGTYAVWTPQELFTAEQEAEDVAA